MSEQLGQPPASAQGFRANLALGLGLAALITWIAAVIVANAGDEQGWMWNLMALLGLAALIAGFTARRQQSSVKALVGMVIGGLLVLMFLGFVIVDLVS